MKDEELGYDRSHWIVHYGDGNGSFDENTYDVDIHTITILIEQVRRFGRRLSKLRKMASFILLQSPSPPRQPFFAMGPSNTVAGLHPPSIIAGSAAKNRLRTVRRTRDRSKRRLILRSGEGSEGLAGSGLLLSAI